MAGDWIPMRLDLREDPAVICMSENLDCEPDLIVGMLHRVWSWASHQSEDGNVPKLKLASIGRLTTPEFVESMQEVGWIKETEFGIEFPNFDRWMGQSAKKRLAATRRQQRKRVTDSCDKSVTDVTDKNSVSSTEQGARDRLGRDLRREIFLRDKDTCQYCGWTKGDRSPFGSVSMQIDHVIPTCQGGPDSAENLVVACSVCNNRKGGRSPAEAGMRLADTCHETVTKFCDKSVTTVEESTEEKSKEEGATCGGQPAEKVLMTFPTKDGDWNLVESFVAKLRQTYPRVQIGQQCRQARMWLEANPSRLKTHSGMPKFLNNWLSKAFKDLPPETDQPQRLRPIAEVAAERRARQAAERARQGAGDETR